MVTRPVIDSTASMMMASWFRVRRFKCGLKALRVAMISVMVRLGSDAGRCGKPRYSTFSDHPPLHNFYAFAIVQPAVTVESPRCHDTASLSGS